MGDANRVRGTLARRDGALADVRLGAVTLSLPHRGLAGRRASTSSIRPEAIDVRAEARRPHPGHRAQGSVPGRLMEYSLDSDIGELFVISTAVDRPLARRHPRRRRARRSRRRRDSAGELRRMNANRVRLEPAAIFRPRHARPTG